MHTINNIAKVINGKIEGNPDLRIQGVCDIRDGKSNKIAYILSEKYMHHIDDTKAAALVINNSLKINRKNKTLIRVENPALSFIEIINMFSPIKKQKSNGIHPKALVSNDVELGSDIYIGPYAVIEKGVKIGNHVSIGAGTFIGVNTNIGHSTNIMPNVSIYHDISIGNNCVIDSGTIIGADGFGLVTHDGTHPKAGQP